MDLYRAQDTGQLFGDSSKLKIHLLYYKTVVRQLHIKVICMPLMNIKASHPYTGKYGPMVDSVGQKNNSLQTSKEWMTDG